MKIALVLPSVPGYSETFFRSKIKGLQDYGHEVILITNTTKNKFEACKHQMHPKVYKSIFSQFLGFLMIGIQLLPHLKTVLRYTKLEKQNNKSLKTIVKLIYINSKLLQLKVDWLHFGFATMAVNREFVAKAIEAKMAVSFRGYDINVYPLKNPLIYIVLWSQVTKVHSISNHLLEKAFKMGLSKQIPNQIITPAIDLKALPQLIPSLKSPILKIVTIARLNFIKGIDVLLEIANILKQRKINFIWDIIGNGDKNSEERYFYNCHRLGLEDHVKFLGKLKHQEALDFLRMADMYVQTSLTEGFCNAVLEAQSLGKLTLAFAEGGLPENILHEKTGFLVSKVSAIKMAEKIVEVYNMPDKLKQSIEIQAIQRVHTDFSLKQQSEAFHQFYTT